MRDEQGVNNEVTQKWIEDEVRSIENKMTMAIGRLRKKGKGHDDGRSTVNSNGTKEVEFLGKITSPWANSSKGDWSPTQKKGKVIMKGDKQSLQMEQKRLNSWEKLPPTSKQSKPIWLFLNFFTNTLFNVPLLSMIYFELLNFYDSILFKSNCDILKLIPTCEDQIFTITISKKKLSNL